MSKITDLPISERPREKAKRYGISSLSDSELLALMLRSGYVGSNASDIANIILSNSCGLVGVSNLSFNELKKFKGVKESKALILASAFEIHKRLSIKENENDPMGSQKKWETGTLHGAAYKLNLIAQFHFLNFDFHLIIPYLDSLC